MPKFAIDGADLEVAGPLDYETATFHDVTVIADNGIGDIITRTFRINVTDVAVETGAASMLTDETDGFAVDFTLNDVAVKRAGVITSSTVASFFTQAGSRGAGVFALSAAGLAVDGTDDIRFPKTAIPYIPAAGTWVVNLKSPSPAFPARVIGYDTDSAAPLMLGADGVIYVYPTPSYVSATTETGTSYVTGAKVAAAYDAAGCGVLITGAPITTTADVMKTVGTLIFIGSVNSSNQMTGTIRTVKYVPRKMPPAELITETT